MFALSVEPEVLVEPEGSRLLTRSRADPQLGCLDEVGGLVVLLDTATFSATAQNIESGAVVSVTEAKSVGCLGLKLKLPGKTVFNDGDPRLCAQSCVAGGSYACCRLGDSGQGRTLMFLEIST